MMSDMGTLLIRSEPQTLSRRASWSQRRAYAAAGGSGPDAALSRIALLTRQFRENLWVSHIMSCDQELRLMHAFKRRTIPVYTGPVLPGLCASASFDLHGHAHEKISCTTYRRR